MKPFIYSNEKEECAFEGVRLRKNLKGALELAKVSYVSNFFAAPDIFHTFSPIKEDVIKEAKESGAKIVTSVFYASHDPLYTFLEKTKNGYEISKLGQKTLLASDMIFVPNAECEQYLLALGLEMPIIVLTPGINLSRFDGIDELEKEVFGRYAGLQKEQKYVISSGDYKDIEGLKRLSYLAKIHPNLRFFFFGSNDRGISSYHYRKRLSKLYGQNISFYGLVEDDVYRSAMSGALAYLSLGSLPDYLGVLDAMSSKTPVYEITRPIFGNLAKNGKTGWVHAEIENLDQCFSLMCQREENPTIIEAYEFAKSNSLRKLGEELIRNYETLLNSKENNSND